MAGFGMRERGFNTIISGMIVSHYSAVVSRTGMRVGCLLRGRRDVCCCTCDVVHFVDCHHSPTCALLLFLVPEMMNVDGSVLFVVGLKYKLRD